MNTQWIEITSRWRIAAKLLLVVILVLAPSFGLGRLQVSTDQNIFFGKDNPEFLAYQLLENTFGSDDSIIFVIGAENNSIFTSANLSSIFKLTEAAWSIPFTTSVDSLTNFQHSWANEDEITIEELIQDPAQLTDNAIQRLRYIAINDPMIDGLLVSHDEKTAAVIVSLHYSPDDATAVPAIMTTAKSIKADITNKNPNLTVALTGSAPLSNAFQEASMTDGAILFPITLAAIVIAFYWLWRSIFAAVAPVLLVAAASLAAMGLAGWLDFPVTPLLAIVPVLLLTIGVADLVHLNQSYGRFLEASTPVVAAARAVRHNLRPIILTTLSTAIGFSSFAFADSPPLRQFGVCTAYGVFVTMFLALLVYPSALRRLGATIRFRGGNKKVRENWKAFVCKRPISILTGGVASIIALALIGIPSITLDDRFDNYFDQSFEVRRDIEFARDRLLGVYKVDFLIAATGPNMIFEPANLQSIDRFVDWLSKKEIVAHVSSFTHVLKKLNMNMHGDDRTYNELPNATDQAAQYALLYNMSLPYGQDLNDILSIDGSMLRITATTPRASAAQIRQLKADAESIMRDQNPSLTVTGAGTGVMFAFISERNIRSMTFGTLTIIGIITLIFAVYFRSVKMAAAGLLANLAPLVVGFSIWGILFKNIGMASSIIAALSLGLIVDDTVHFLSRFKEANSSDGGLSYAFEISGTAIIQTSFILFLGFAALATSGFTINFTIGVLLMIIIVSALVVDLALLPAFLRLAYPQRNNC